MSVRDNVLPPLDAARAVVAGLGLRRFTVTLRRRTWSGTRVGDGSPSNSDILLTPTPKCRFMNPFARQMEAILASGGSIRDRYYKIDKITPSYNINGVTGGYSPAQLRMVVGPDQQNVDPIVVLVGDDGVARECTQVLFKDDRAFGHAMVVQERDRPTIALVSIAVTPNPAALVRPATLQFIATGTFEDGSISDVSAISRWSSGTPSIATVSLLGLATGVAAGTSAISASIGGISSPAVTLTVT